jgi:hypothetical protein
MFMIVSSLVYSMMVFQAFLNAIFHLNWLQKPKVVPRLLMFAYIFAFIWYASSIILFSENAFFLNRFNKELLDFTSVLAIASSLIFATYYILMLRPIKVSEGDEISHYYFAFPIHLLLYIGLIISTSLFNY